MRITGETASEGVIERQFDLDVGEERVTGVSWSPADASPGLPVLLMGHGGGQHKKYPGIVSRAQRYVTSFGFEVVAIDAPGHGDRIPSEQDLKFVAEMRNLASQGKPFGEVVARQNSRLAQIAVPEWQSTLEAVWALDSMGTSRPVGYWGLSMGGAIGVHLIAAEPRINAAVIGLLGLFPTNQDLAEAAARVTIPIEFMLQSQDELVPRDKSLALFDEIGSNDKTLHENPGGHTDIPLSAGEGWERFFSRHLLSTI